MLNFTFAQSPFFKPSFILVSGVSFYLNATVNPFLYSLLSKRFRRGYHDLKSCLFCQNKGNTSTDNNQGPCANEPKTGIGVELNPEAAAKIMPFQPYKWENRGKSHSHCQFVPNHTTSFNKQSFISEPHQGYSQNIPLLKGKMNSCLP